MSMEKGAFVVRHGTACIHAFTTRKQPNVLILCSSIPYQRKFKTRSIFNTNKNGCKVVDGNASSKSGHHFSSNTSSCYCNLCRRALLLNSTVLLLPKNANANVELAMDTQRLLNEFHPSRPDWYEEFYAFSLIQGMRSYEKEIAGYKELLLNPLRNEAETILDLGIGTGPNIKYYSNKNLSLLLGVDPNKHMEKYAKAAAVSAGLKDSQFKFIHGVGEALPVQTSTIDVVVCTLVLCSVKDISKTLKEIQRVLKPHGRFIFIEHVAAADGTGLRFWQEILNPIQQFVSDGCHLTSKTRQLIEESNFSDLNAQSISLSSVSLISPHVLGTAYN